MLFQDAGGRKVDPSKAFWANGAAQVLLARLDDLEKKGQSDISVIDDARSILALFAKHFETLGKSGLKQSEARKKAAKLRELWAHLET
ncbi:MAG: hypothetical protein U0931_02435 [Vulcanimicrobiota bacterium]